MIDCIHCQLKERIAADPGGEELVVTPEERDALLVWLIGDPPLLGITPEPDSRKWRFFGRKLVVRP
jgi:hypothetical protein